jgi:hypothetical protein
MLQIFHIDVAKVDRDVAYVVMVVHVCCNLLFPMFHLFFSDVCSKCVWLDVAYVSHIYCKYFIWMLHMFHNGFKCFLYVFASVLDAFFKGFICLQTYVASVVSGCFKSRSGVASPSLPQCLLLLAPTDIQTAQAGVPPHPKSIQPI